MKPVLTAEEMRACEKRLFETGVPSINVMERAAKALADAVWAMLPENGTTCVFACGSGGNGGDGYAAARIFAHRGGRAIVLEVAPPKTPEAIINRDRALKSCFAAADLSSLGSLPRPDVWADCVFGIGLTRNIEDEGILKLFERIRQDRAAGSAVVSCDIPSGLNADTGKIMGACVTADRTITFEWAKRGHYLGSGPDVCGALSVCAIEIGDERLPDSYARLVEKADLAKALPARKRTAHKNDFGHLLIVAGSFGMAGAAALAALAAMRTGAGLVTVACPASIVPVLQTLAPTAMCIPLDEKDGAVSENALYALRGAFSGKTAVAIGPGLSRRASARCVEAVLKCGLPAVFDADALNIISENEALRQLLSPNHAITPHPGEARRLIGSLSSDPVDNLRALSALGCCPLYKGASTLILDGGVYISASGTSGMAKGGSGDALTGMTGAFLAMGVSPGRALWLASELHGLAGEIAAKKRGAIAMLPTDLIDAIGDAYNDVYA